MFHTKLVGWVLAGLIGGVAIAGPMGAGVAGCRARLGELPLGKLLIGNLGRWMVLRSELNVTDQQKAQIRETVIAHKPEIAAAAKGVWDRRTALREAVLAGKDEAAIRAAADQLGKAAGDAAVLAAKVASELKPILTAEQQQMIRQTRGECDQAVQRFFAQAIETQ